MKPAALLVHGIFDRGQIFKSLAEYLRGLGITPYFPDFVPNDGSSLLEELAAQVGEHVDTILCENESVFLVGFSMGGLVCRYYMQSLEGVSKVKKWISISSPHYGTWTASLYGGRGVAQMRVGSSFLNELNNDLPVLESVPTLSLWTPYDLMIIPATSSKLPIGDNVSVNCLAHPLMNNNKSVQKHIGNFLLSDHSTNTS